LLASNSLSQPHENAAVLIIVLWIAIGLVSIALYFSSSMTYELRASDNRVSGLETQQAIEGAARYVNFALYNYSTNGAVPANTQFSCQAVPVGDAHFWVIGRDPSETPSSDPYFGLVDEGAKLNLNTVGTNTLECLPNMTTDFAEAIVDWRSTNGLGLNSMDYTALGYNDKNEPFETVDELRLVYGATMDLLVGNDANRNGILDGNEQSNGGTEVEPGLLEYCTVYTREPNFNTSGVLLTNVNTATAENLRTLFETANVSTTYATRIYNHVHSTGGRGATTTTTFNGMLDFCAYCKNTLSMSSDDFSKIYPYVTTSTSTYISGRVNIDTASSTVLTALFMGLGYNQGVDQGTAESAAQTILNYRQQNPDNLTSIAWLMDALGSTSPVITALRRGDYITTHSYQFSADIAAVGPYGRGYRRVKFIFDTSNGTPAIIYRRDLSSLGWALGDKVRQTWVVNATQ
jgi:DNA uptake protein ComE-like DNA-binding protein